MKNDIALKQSSASPKFLYGEDEQVFTIQMFFSFFSHL